MLCYKKYFHSQNVCFETTIERNNSRKLVISLTFIQAFAIICEDSINFPWFRVRTAHIPLTEETVYLSRLLGYRRMVSERSFPFSASLLYWNLLTVSIRLYKDSDVFPNPGIKFRQNPSILETAIPSFKFEVDSIYSTAITLSGSTYTPISFITYPRLCICFWKKWHFDSFVFSPLSTSLWKLLTQVTITQG